MIDWMWRSPAVSPFRNGHHCLEERMESSSLRFFKDNRGFVHPDWISFSCAPERGWLTLRGITTKKAVVLTQTHPGCPLGSSRQKPTSLYPEVDLGKDGQMSLFPRTSQYYDFQKSFSRQSDHLRVNIWWWCIDAGQVWWWVPYEHEWLCKSIPSSRKTQWPCPGSTSFRPSP